MRSGERKVLAILICGLLLSLISCKRESRQFRASPPYSDRIETVPMTDLQAGSAPPSPPTNNPYEDMAYEISEGQQLYDWYNCSGCHAHGGGDIGPPLMDDKWIYGSDPANIFQTIVEGRPNGMPSFRNKIPDNQVWQIVAYVRSMSGLVRKDVAPGRTDHMQMKQSEQSTKTQVPISSSPPGAAQGAR